MRAWGSAERGPDATIVGKGCHSLPRRRRADSSDAAISRSVRPTRMVGSTSASASCARAAAARMATTSSGDFTARSRSTWSAAGTMRLRVSPVTRSASFTVSAWASMPIAPGGSPARTRASRSHTLDWSTSTAAASPASAGAWTA